MTQGRVCPSLDNDFYVVAAPLSKEKEVEEGIPTEEELRKVRGINEGGRERHAPTRVHPILLSDTGNPLAALFECQRGRNPGSCSLLGYHLFRFQPASLWVNNE